jgi:hypothetical protein
MTIAIQHAPTPALFWRWPRRVQQQHHRHHHRTTVSRSWLPLPSRLQSARSLEVAKRFVPVRRSQYAQPIKDATPPWLFCPRDLLASACLAHDDQILLGHAEGHMPSPAHDRSRLSTPSGCYRACAVRINAVETSDGSVRAPPLAAVLGCLQRCAREPSQTRIGEQVQLRQPAPTPPLSGLSQVTSTPTPVSRRSVSY